MRHNLGRDFSRLSRASNPSDPRAPWWVNWLLQLGVAALSLWALAAGADWAWHALTGRQLGAACGLVGLLPLDWLMPVGLVMGLVGIVLVMVGKSRAAGLLWFILGTLLYTTPELMPALGLNANCIQAANF
jgi:hypothetical protein